MLRAERELRIINRLRSEKIARLSDLAADIGVSENTLRRDLQRLHETGILRRTHGGAVFAEDSRDTHGIDDLDWLARLRHLPAEKERIGKAAAALVQDGEAIILDAGTTTMQIARHLHDRRNLTAVTNAVNIGLELSPRGAITVVLTGGILREISRSLIGPLAEDFLGASIHADRLFLSAGGVSLEAGVTNANTIEVPVKRAMIKAAREVVLVVTGDKVGRRSFTQVTPLESLTAIVTDGSADPGMLEAMRSRGVRIIVA
jgi:DeoR family transcriptional regulator, fructose operon transcriptional repressor